MAAGQPLRGLVAQGMDGQRAAPEQDEPYSFPAAASAYSWSVPRTGKWKFVGWGAGGVGISGASGGSGGYFEITRQLVRGQTITITAGIQASSDTSVVIGTETATAVRATGGTAGSATGGDVNLAGSAGLTGAVAGNTGNGTGGGAGGATAGGLAGGAGAPANLPYRGGQGGVGNGGIGNVGSGAGEVGAGSAGGGPGLVLAVLIRGS